MLTVRIKCKRVNATNYQQKITFTFTIPTLPIERDDLKKSFNKS